MLRATISISRKNNNLNWIFLPCLSHFCHFCRERSVSQIISSCHGLGCFVHHQSRCFGTRCNCSPSSIHFQQSPILAASYYRQIKTTTTTKAMEGPGSNHISRRSTPCCTHTNLRSTRTTNSNMLLPVPSSLLSIHIQLFQIFLLNSSVPVWMP